MPPPLDAALDFALAGIPVLPLHTPTPRGGCSCARPECTSVGKHPRWHRRLITAGLHDATTDPERVRRWWRTWPAANIGLRTGEALDVCDVDTPQSLAALRDLLDAADPPLVRTGSGGWHLYFAASGAPNRVRVLPGVDWRGAGGYVVAPPSRHASGRRYRWIRPLAGAPPPCPPGLVDLLTGRPVPVYHPAPVYHPDRYAAAALANEAMRVAGAPIGARNDTLYRAARGLGGLVAAGMLDEREVTDVLSDAARRAGLGRAEVSRTLHSGLTTGRRTPRRAA